MEKSLPQTAKVAQKQSRFKIEKLEERIAPTLASVSVDATATVNGQTVVDQHQSASTPV